MISSPTGDGYVFCYLPWDGCGTDSRGRLSLQMIRGIPLLPSLGGFVFFRRKRQTILSIPCRDRRPLSRVRLYTVMQEDCIHILCFDLMLLEAERSVAKRGFQKRRAA